MIHQLITLLQEESKRICGTALPPEMCRHILIRYGGWQAPSAIAWKGQDWLPELRLDLIRLKWNKFNAAVAQKRKKNSRWYHSAHISMHPETPYELGDYRFWVQGWVWRNFIEESAERRMQEAESAGDA